VTGDANLAGRLIERARRHPERAAIVEYGRGRARRMSFGELAERVAHTATRLHARGITPGDRVLLFVPMSAALYVALLGCMHAGAAAVFVDAWADRRRLEAAVRATRPVAFMGTWKAQLLRLVSPSIRRIGIRLGTGGVTPVRHDSSPPVPVAPDHPALITFTTGSTGSPKAAARSHGFLWAQHLALARHLELREDDVDMPTLPIFVLNNLALGVTSAIPDFDPRRPADIRPAAIWSQIRAEGVTTTSGSPAFYDRLLAWGEARNERLPVRALFTGGAPVLPPLARRLRDGVAGAAHVLYGSTEAEPISGIEAGELLRSDAGDGGRGGVCVGRPDPGIELRILRACDWPIDGSGGGLATLEVAPGETGEIVVSGPHVLAGYLDDPEAERRAKIRDGSRVWHRTGDGGRLDPAGRLWLMGRVRERVRRYDDVWWSLPPEVAALRHPAVRHAAYLGLADPARGQRAVLCVECRTAITDADRTEIARLAAPSPVDDLRVMRTIPRDPRHASKTDTEALRRLLGASPAAP
jgi:olefin beta-lactone synthetase